MPQRRPAALERLDSELNTIRLSRLPVALAASSAPGGGASAQISE